jgi:hypothetical protein
VSDDAPVVWLDDGTAREDAVRALGEWARARGVRLGVLEEHPRAVAIDPSLGEQAEKELDRARLAIAAADADAAERALARAENVLRQHPELPQAAWLRAEVERAWSARWLRLEPRDEARARAAWENAQALDGGRVPGIGDTSFPPRRKVKATIVVAGGASPRRSVRVDGAPVEPDISRADGTEYQIEVAPAEHHLVVTSDGNVLFASWIAIAGAEPLPTRISVTDDGACGRDRLSEVRHQEGQVQAMGVTCPRWIAAAPGATRGSVLVARCERDTCSSLLEWRIEQLPAQVPPQAHGKLAGWPSWATWAIVGVGAATVTTMALIATGVFETRPVEPRFVVGGARQE